MAWLCMGWAFQISKLPAANQSEALVGWRDVLLGMTQAEIARARTSWDEKYPPDARAFKIAGQRVDAAEQFYHAARAAGCVPPAWHTLEARTYTTAKLMVSAGWNIRELNWTRGSMQAAWVEKYRAACRMEDLDPGLLEQPPSIPQAALPIKTNIGAAKKHISQIREMIAGKKP